MYKNISRILFSILSVGSIACEDTPELPSTVTAKILEINLQEQRVSLVATQSNDKDITGTWSVSSANTHPGEFSDIHDPLAYFTGDVFETYHVKWTMDNGKDSKAGEIEFSIGSGYEVYDFVQANISVSRLLEVYGVYPLLVAHVEISALVAAGATPKNLMAAGVTPAELLDLGIEPLTLYLSGASVKDLIAYDRKNIKLVFDAGATPLELSKGGALLKELKNLGYTNDVLLSSDIIGTLQDIEGNTYRWVRIGEQVWMADNLKASHTADGNLPVYPVYAPANDENNVAVYGRLYRYPLNNSGRTSANPSGVQGVCPNGWHLPSGPEWSEMEDVVGVDAGIKLKLEGTAEDGNGLWVKSDPVYAGTNESGFNAVPSGYGTWQNIPERAGLVLQPVGNNIVFATASASSVIENYPTSFSLSKDSKNLYFNWNSYGINSFAVRCVRD